MCQILQSCHVTSTQMSCRWSACHQHQNLAGCGGCIIEGTGILILFAVSFLAEFCVSWSPWYPSNHHSVVLYFHFTNFTYKGFPLPSRHASGHAWPSTHLSPLVTGAAGDQENNTQISSDTDCAAWCLQDLIRCKPFSSNNPNPYWFQIYL